MSIIKGKAGLEDNRLFLFFLSSPSKLETSGTFTNHLKSSRS
jgi:hypothetical protein